MTKKVGFHFKSLEESPGYLLAQLTLLWQRKQKKVLDLLGLTYTQFALMAALGWLSKEKKEITQIDVAGQTNFDRMMVSKVLRTLEAKKFITRQEHKTDTRAKIVELTSEGATVLQKAIFEVEQVDIDFFSSIKAELPFFNSSMVKLIDNNRNELHISTL